MNSRERVLAVMNRKVPDRIPKDLSWGLCPALEEEFKRRTGCDDYYDYFDLDVRILDFGPTKQKRDFSQYYIGRDQERGFSIDEWGVGSGRSQDESLHFEHRISPLKEGMTEEEAATFPLPDFLEEYRHCHFKEKVEEYHAAGLAVCANLTTTIFEKAWAIRGFEETMMDMLTDQSFLRNSGAGKGGGKKMYSGPRKEWRIPDRSEPYGRAGSTLGKPGGIF